MNSQTNPPTATQRLERAERLVAEWQRQIEGQKLFVADMEQAALLAREVLASFEDAQTLRIAERDRLVERSV